MAAEPIECWVCRKEGGSKVCSNSQCNAIIHADCLQEYRREMHKIGRGAVCACTESLDWQALRWPTLVSKTARIMVSLLFLGLVFEWLVWRSPSLREAAFQTSCVVYVIVSRFDKLYRLFLTRQTASKLDVGAFIVGLVIVLGMCCHFLSIVLSGRLWPDYLFSMFMGLLLYTNSYLDLLEFIHWLARLEF